MDTTGGKPTVLIGGITLVRTVTDTVTMGTINTSVVITEDTVGVIDDMVVATILIVTGSAISKAISKAISMKMPPLHLLPLLKSKNSRF